MSFNGEYNVNEVEGKVNDEMEGNVNEVEYNVDDVEYNVIEVEGNVDEERSSFLEVWDL